MKELKELVTWYEELKEADVDRINSFYTDNAFFKDPFNEFEGRERIGRIFKHMFENLEKPHFVFVDIINNVKSDRVAFVTWDFIFLVKGKEYKIHGSSHLKFEYDESSNEYFISYHRDYWDVGEELLLKLPIIKSLYGALRKKLEVH